MFESLTWLIIAFSLSAAGYAYVRTRDPFHPTIPVLLMCAVLYGVIPMSLHRSGELSFYLSREELRFVQGLNLAGICAFAAGCFYGARGRGSRRIRPFPWTRTGRLAVFRAATVAGSIGIGGWLYGLANRGGFAEAYGQVKGGGWSDSGYVRDAPFLTFSAVALLFLATAGRKFRPIDKAALVVFSTPMLVQGLLGARRGPTFVILTVLLLGWFLTRGTRPPVVAAALGAYGIGYLLLFLVVNRSEIFLGSEFELNTEVTQFMTRPGGSNEFIYGSGAVVHAKQAEKYFWGKRYLAQILVRPIPRQIWPTKYQDFGVGEIEVNFGTGYDSISRTMGWHASRGAAPGIIADLWIEFCWFAIPAMGLLGWFHGYVWRRAVRERGFWALQYTVVFALSIYMVMQTMEAVIFRFLIISAPIWVIWWRVTRLRQRRSRKVHRPINVGRSVTTFG